MKNLLAENMLRFGVKNLQEENKKTLKILTESLQGADPQYVEFLKAVPEFNSIVKAGASQMSNIMGNRQLISSMSNEDVLYSVIAVSLKTQITGNKEAPMSAQQASAYFKDTANAKEVKNLTKLTRPLTNVTGRGKVVQPFRQLNQNPNNPGKVFAAGTWSAEDGFVMDQKDKGFGQQTVDQIIDACNTYNISQAVVALSDPNNSPIDALAAAQTIVIRGNPMGSSGSDKRQGRNAEWVWGVKRTGLPIVCYTGGESIDPRSTTKADFDIEIEKEEGGKVPLPMPETAFQKGKVELNMAVVNQFIQDIKAMGNPLSLDVVASASGGEKYNKGGNSSTHNLDSGFPVNHDGTSKYDVTGRPTESGNATLANTRADQLVKALEAAFPKAKITKKAIITPGSGPTARYVKAFSQIEKPGKPGEVMTSMDLKQITSQKGTDVNRGEGFQIKGLRWAESFWSALGELNQFTQDLSDPNIRALR